MGALQRFRLGLLILVAVMVIGAGGYMLLEGWSLIDALYMSVHTVTTVGMGEVRPLSPAGRLFTVTLILSGVTAGAYMAATFAEFVVGTQVREVLGRRRMQKDLARLDNHYIVCGWGRMGQELVEQFLKRRVPFVVIELSPDKCRRLGERGVLYVNGDASDDQMLCAAGVERARGLIAVAPKDADNIFITLSARSLNKKLFIVARSIYEQDVHKLEVAGADRVISPYVIGARRIAAAVFHPAVSDFLDQEVERPEMEWEMQDIQVTARAPFEGRSIADSSIREKTGCTILAIRGGAEGRFHNNPAPDTVLREGDTLVVLGTRSQLERLEEMARLSPEERHARVPLRSQRI